MPSWRTPKAVALAALLVAALGAFAGSASPADASTLVVQPDGKIVVAGRIVWHEAGALARLNPDGSLDSGFAEGGFLLDRRLPAFRALALDPDGNTLGAAVAGSLARYLPNGAVDPSFGAGGLGGSDEPGQSHFLFAEAGASALLVQPGGGLVVAGNHEVGSGEYDTWVRRYDAAGRGMEPVGSVPQLGGSDNSTKLDDLVEEPDGSLIGAGSTNGSEESRLQERPLLARFVPGSGTRYDPAFGGGAGLVRPSSAAYGNAAGFRAIARDGDGLLAAGKTDKTFLLARYHSDGTLDSAFGEGGFSAPPIEGPAAHAEYATPRSWAEDVAVSADGGIVVGGATEQWGTWSGIQRDLSPRCVDCPQPMLAKFDPGGHLSPGFGNGGLLLLRKPDGGPFQASVAGVTPLASGAILVNGYTPKGAAFVARLNPDGSYDQSFGANGLVVLEFPCSIENEAQQRAAGCLPSAEVTLRGRHLRGAHPSLSMTVAPNLTWAAIKKVTLSLPQGLLPTRRLQAQARVIAVGGTGRGKVDLHRARRKRPASLAFSHFGLARKLQVRLATGSLRPLSPRRRRAKFVRFRVGVEFANAAGWDTFAQTVVRTVRVRPAGA